MSTRSWPGLFMGRLRYSIEQSAHYSRHNATLVGLLGTVGYPLYYYIWAHLFPQPYENLWLRLVGTLLFLPLLLYRYWPERLRQWFTLYWLVVLIYGLPFFFTYMLLRNEMSLVWSMSTMAALFLLVLVIYDWLMVVVMATAGFLLAWLFFLFMTGETALQGDYLIQLPIYIFVIVAGNIFNYTANMVKEEKMNAYATMGRNIAHELRTPLLGIRGAAAALDDYLPALMDGYTKARYANLEVRPIRAPRLAGLEDSARIIVDEVNYANTVIDMLLLSAAQSSITNANFSLNSINDTIDEALERYPFRSNLEKSLVRRDEGNDFTYLGPRVLMVHVLFNLLKNALQSTQAAGKGSVLVSSSTDEDRNTVIVRDTGLGIEPDRLRNIFSQFSTSKTPDQGTGIGLSFCKLVMENMGGSIECRSEYGQYTDFILVFPETEDAK